MGTAPELAPDIEHLTEEERRKFFSVQRRLGGVSVSFEVGNMTTVYSKDMLSEFQSGVEVIVPAMLKPERNIIFTVTIADTWQFLQDVQGNHNPATDDWRYIVALP